MKIQNYFYAFFITIAIIIITVTSLVFYNRTADYQLVRNIYNYSDESYEKLVESNLAVDSYNAFIDCNINSEGFDYDNLELYLLLDRCSDLDKVNQLKKFYSNEDVLLLTEIEFDYRLVTETNYLRVLDVVYDQYFKQENFSRYLVYEGQKIVMNVNLNHDLEKYGNYNVVNTIDELVIVNPYNKLVSASNNLYNCNGQMVYSYEMCENVKMFFNELVNENIAFTVVKSFDASNLFDEHATGLAIDLEVYDERIKQVESIASKYGLIFRYKPDYEDVISWGEDNVHLRYVGSSAIAIFTANKSLEEFLYFMD